MARSLQEVEVFLTSVGRFFLDRALYAIAFSVLDIGVVYLMALGLIPKHWMAVFSFSSNEIAFQQDGTAQLLCLVTVNNVTKHIVYSISHI